MHQLESHMNQEFIHSNSNVDVGFTIDTKEAPIIASRRQKQLMVLVFIAIRYRYFYLKRHQNRKYNKHPRHKTKVIALKSKFIHSNGDLDFNTTKNNIVRQQKHQLTKFKECAAYRTKIITVYSSKMTLPFLS